jgi:hypothetical protein
LPTKRLIMAEDKLNYAARAQAALLSVVRDVITETAENGLLGEHHFYITYLTGHPDVVMSDKLRASHDEEITIVLQNQFESLQVMETAFSVRLSFNQEPETLIVPFEAITKFYDPSVAFGLMFDETDEMDEDELDVAAGNISDTFMGASDSEAKDASEDEKQAGEVISLDSFRDK